MAAHPPSRDDLARRCPRLGSHVPFGYCRKCGESGLPCLSVLNCWWETFDVTGYLKETMDPADFEAFADKKPRPKVASLLDLIEEARKSSP